MLTKELLNQIAYGKTSTTNPFWASGIKQVLTEVETNKYSSKAFTPQNG